MGRQTDEHAMLDDARSGANACRKRSRIQNSPECAIQNEVALIGHKWRAACMRTQCDVRT